MGTLDKLALDAAAIMDKVKKGHSMTKEEMKIVSIYNSQFAGKAGNAGKRKIKKTGK